MINAIRRTFTKLLSDKRGEDLAECSSGLSKAAKAAITCGVIAATAAGTANLATGSNNAQDAAIAGVNAPLQAEAPKTQAKAPVYK